MLSSPLPPEISSLCSGKTVKGRHVPGLNVWSLDVMHKWKLLVNDRYLIGGFQSRDIGKVIFPDMEDVEKCGSKTSRTLKKLRLHGLIKKVPRSRHYQVT